METPSEIKPKYNDFIKIVDEICSNDVNSKNIQESMIIQDNPTTIDTMDILGKFK